MTHKRINHKDCPLNAKILANQSVGEAVVQSVANSCVGGESGNGSCVGTLSVTAGEVKKYTETSLLSETESSKLVETSP
jgi:hypothetical protein